ncbi:glutathione S-transferase family protein [bacterium]|nr:glutathione S-transferase family protein [bacterium]
MTEPLYTLHYTPDSAAMIVRLALRLTDAPFAEVLIDRANGGLDSPAYRAMQPLGKIPAMETPHGPMFETGAILLYLADRHPGLAPAPDSPDRAAFLKWYFFTVSYLHTTLLQAFYPERTAGAACAEAVLTHAGAAIRSHFALIDRMVATEAPDWLSARPSILGYYLGVLVRWLSGFPEGHPARLSVADLPALGPILAALETSPAARTVAEAEATAPTLFTKPY